MAILSPSSTLETHSEIINNQEMFIDIFLYLFKSWKKLDNTQLDEIKKILFNNSTNVANDLKTINYIVENINKIQKYFNNFLLICKGNKDPKWVLFLLKIHSKSIINILKNNNNVSSKNYRADEIKEENIKKIAEIVESSFTNEELKPIIIKEENIASTPHKRKPYLWEWGLDTMS